MRTLIVGLGNPILSDDRAGLAAAQLLEQVLHDQPEIDVVLYTCGGLRLMELMVAYDRALILDAIITGARPGSILLLPAGAIDSQRSGSNHDVNLTTALILSRQAGGHLPPDETIHYIGIEAGDIQTFSEECTPEVAPGIHEAAFLALQHLGLPPDLLNSFHGDATNAPIHEF